jgi:hypothetical protein
MTFKVFVARYTETHRVTYMPVLVSSNDSKNMEITPSRHEELEHAEEEAQTYADFLGVSVEPHNFRD